jgi:hypothetical protein
MCSKFKVHRATLTDRLTVDLSLDDKVRSSGRQGTDFYYVRLTQSNGQRAWSSPIWVQG